MKHFEVRQQVGTVEKKWLEVVFKTPPANDELSRRIAVSTYDFLVKTHPREYFELVLVEHSEECIAHVDAHKLSVRDPVEVGLAVMNAKRNANRRSTDDEQVLNG